MNRVWSAVAVVAVLAVLCTLTCGGAILAAVGIE